MERDFLGLAVNQGTSEETHVAAPARSSQMQLQWPFSKKDSSSSSSLLSFHGVQDEKAKSGFDSFARSATLNTVDEAFDSSQRNIASEIHAGVRYTMMTYPTTQVDAYPFQRSMVNQSNPTISTNSMHNSLIANARQNQIVSASSQPLAAVPSMPSNIPVVGATDLRSASNVAGAQLTLFYNGSVCVYDNVAPEKAQAIMLLAGNGPSMTYAAKTLPLAPIPKPNAHDGFAVSQSYNTTPRHITPPPVINTFSVPQSYNNSPTPHRPSSSPLMNTVSVSQSYNNIPTSHFSSPSPLMNLIDTSQPYKNSPPPPPQHCSSPAPSINPISVSQSYPTTNFSSPAPLLNSISVSQSYKNSPTPHRSSPPPLVNSINLSQSYNNSPTPHRSSPAPLTKSVSLSQSYNNIPSPHFSTPDPLKNSHFSTLDPLKNSVSVSQSYKNSPTPHCSTPTPLMNSVSVSQSYKNSPTPHCSTPTPLMNSVSFSQSSNNHPTTHCSSPARVNPISISPSVASHDISLVKPAGVVLSTSKTAEPRRVGHSLGAAPLTSDAVPQFRRRSLARFMERRKERAIVAHPYGYCSKKPGDGSTS